MYTEYVDSVNANYAGERGTIMADWHSEQYLKFAKERTQPARDLAARLTHLRPETVVDIGCGPGNSTQVLREVFPSADLFGIDSSPRMIEQARADHPNLCFRLCDASLLEGRYDLLFSNACLQWIPDHRTLLPALMGHLKDGGVLAVQMPRNGEEPLFRLIEVLAGEPHWDLRNVPGKINETLSPNGIL